ncbi:MAG TPA: TonB family protein [Terracidiphilus sp.]|jgi:TonB family protein|nr:TonB family protein [Terracidiphilus sp.]
MRRILVASFLLSSALLGAQSAAKAQSATLVARSEATNASEATDVPTATHPRRISTGVTAPKLISGSVVKVATTDFPTEDLSTQHVVVSFRVDEKGTPLNVHLLKSVNQSVDGKVLEAVRQYRFAPATLDDEAVPMDVNLLVSFQAR